MTTHTEFQRPFIGRQHELEQLNLLTHKKTASLVVLKGRRRIGKSRLLQEFTKKHKASYRFTGLSPERGITAEHQRAEFAKRLQSQFDIPPITSHDWGDLFEWLGKLTAKGRVIIVLDEISWMAMDDPTFLPKLKDAWDEHFSQNPRLMLVLCGSVSTWIEKNILSSSGFFGRIASEISLRELSIPNCYTLLKELGFQGSTMEFFMILSLTGGIPWYLELMNPKLSAAENIKNLCFTREGILVKEYNKIFHDLFGKRSDIYRRIIDVLAMGPKEYKEISTATHYPSGGPLSEYLDELSISGYIRKDEMWNINTGKPMNVSQYRINDNYLRFYLKCVGPNLTKISSNLFQDQSLSALHSWPTILGLQFENLVLNNRELIWKKLQINPIEIINENPYIQRATKNKKGCQVDYLIQTKFNILYLCECKLTQGKVGMSVIREVQNKMDALERQNKFACKPVLIYVGELTKDVLEAGFFAHFINLNELIEERS